MKINNLPLFIILFALLVAAGLATSDAGVSRGNQRNTNQGVDALHNNSDGSDNSAFGYQALFSNTVGNQNTAVGSQALYNYNAPVDSTLETAVGFQASYSDISGFANQAFGGQALFSNIDGTRNCAVGATALFSFTGGDSNTSVGNASMLNTVTANYNTAIGRRALFRVNASNNNIALGFYAASNLRTGDNNIEIGNLGINNESNTIRIGTVTPANTVPDNTPQNAHTDTYIAGIFGSSTIAPGMPVYVDANGKLGTLPSSNRFKEAVKPMNGASEEIFSLKPVTFRYKPEVTKDSSPQFGLVAEEVAKVDPNLVVLNQEGNIQSVRYEAVNAMLLNEFLKEHRQVQEQQKQIDKLTVQLNEQAALLQQVSARIELNKPRTTTVAAY